MGYNRENSDKNVLEGETERRERVGGVHMCAYRNQRLTLGAFLHCYRYYYFYYYSLLLLFKTRSLTDWLGWLASELQKRICLCSIELTAQAYAAMPAFTWVLGIITQALKFVQQVLHRLSHFPRH